MIIQLFILVGLLIPSLSQTTKTPDTTATRSCVVRVRTADFCYIRCDADGNDVIMDMNNVLLYKDSAERLRVACADENIELKNVDVDSLEELRVPTDKKYDTADTRLCGCPVRYQTCPPETLNWDGTTCTKRSCTYQTVTRGEYTNRLRTITSDIVDSAICTDRTDDTKPIPTTDNKDTACTDPCNTDQDRRICVINTDTQATTTVDCRNEMDCIRLQTDAALEIKDEVPCEKPTNDECDRVGAVTWRDTVLGNDPNPCPVSCVCKATDAGNRLICDTNRKNFIDIKTECADYVRKCGDWGDVRYSQCPTDCSDFQCSSFDKDATGIGSTTDVGDALCRKSDDGWQIASLSDRKNKDSSTCNFCICGDDGVLRCKVFDDMTTEEKKEKFRHETCATTPTYVSCGVRPDCPDADCARDDYTKDGQCAEDPVDDPDRNGDTRDRIVVTTKRVICLDRLTEKSRSERFNIDKSALRSKFEDCGCTITNFEFYISEYGWDRSDRDADDNCKEYGVVTTTCSATGKTRDDVKCAFRCLANEDDDTRANDLAGRADVADRKYRTDTNDAGETRGDSIECVKDNTSDNTGVAAADAVTFGAFEPDGTIIVVPLVSSTAKPVTSRAETTMVKQETSQTTTTSIGEITERSSDSTSTSSGDTTKTDIVDDKSDVARLIGYFAILFSAALAIN